MPNSLKEILAMFALFTGLFGVILFPVFLILENFITALWYTPLLSMWISACFMGLLMGHETLESKNYTLKNFWWRWLSREVRVNPNSTEEIAEMDQWCKENIKGKWERYGGSIYYFFRPESALAFKLRWYE